MKPNLFKTLVPTAACFAVGLNAGRSQNYSIDSYRISGGDTTNTNGLLKAVAGLVIKLAPMISQDQALGKFGCARICDLGKPKTLQP